MPDSSALPLFITASLAVLIIPGPAMLYIVTRSVDQGRVAGIVSVFGIETGTFCHVVAAGLGLSAVLMSSALAFTIVKFLGAGYLIYLGLQKILDSKKQAQSHTPTPKGLPRIYSQGVVVNLTNPKTALFFFAFLPQFVDPARGSVSLQMLLLGCIYVGLGICNYGFWALLAGTLGHYLKGNMRSRRVQRYLSGGVYIALGMTTALVGSNSK